MRVRRDLEFLPTLFYLSLSEIADKVQRYRSACEKTGKLHSKNSLTPFRITQTFDLTAARAEGLFREIMGGARARDMPAMRFWCVLALFARAPPTEIGNFINFFLPDESDYFRTFSFLFDRVLEVSDDPHFLAACHKAVRDFAAPPADEISEWRSVLDFASKNIVVPLSASRPHTTPAGPRRPTSRRAGPVGSLAALTGAEMTTLQTLWFESGGSLERALDMRIFMLVLKNASKNPKQSEFLDKVVANIMAIGSAQGPKFFEARRTFEEVVRLLIPNDRFQLAIKTKTSEAENVRDTATIGNAALVELRQLYAVLKEERNIGESLKLSNEEISRLPVIRLDTFEKFLEDFLPAGFVGDVSKLHEWIDVTASLQEVGVRIHRPSVLLKDLPSLRPDAADAEVKKLEQKLNNSNRSQRKSMVDTRRLVFNEISFDRPHTSA
jgi:hypothetical protein